MIKDRYKVEDAGAGFFRLFLGSEYLTSFRRETFREKLELLAVQKGFSANWIGSILRIFLKQHPLPLQPGQKRTDLDRLNDDIGIEGIADQVRHEGLRVRKISSVSLIDKVRLLEKYGYEVNGMIGDVYYDTCELQKAVSAC